MGDGQPFWGCGVEHPDYSITTPDCPSEDCTLDEEKRKNCEDEFCREVAHERNRYINDLATLRSDTDDAIAACNGDAQCIQAALQAFLDGYDQLRDIYDQEIQEAKDGYSHCVIVEACDCPEEDQQV